MGEKVILLIPPGGGAVIYMSLELRGVLQFFSFSLSEFGHICIRPEELWVSRLEFLLRGFTQSNQFEISIVGFELLP